MRSNTSRCAAALIALLLAPMALLSGADAGSKPAASPASRRVERGKYLVTIMSCNDCHTPWKMGPNGVPEPDMTRMLSGHPEGMKMPPPPPPSGPWVVSIGASFTAFAGPFGVTYTTNLTPDKNTGLGIWTEEMFVKAMRKDREALRNVVRSSRRCRGTGFGKRPTKTSSRSSPICAPSRPS